MDRYIKTDQHTFVCGRTGTGKSFLVEHYLAGYPFVIKLDTKNVVDERRRSGEPLWYGLIEGEDYSVCTRLEEMEEIETKKIIYAPDFEEQTPDNFNVFFDYVYRRGNTILWIDELMDVGSPNSYPPYLRRLATQGRSKNVGVWFCTQRPSSIPTITIANCTHYFVFDLNLPADRKKIVEMTGCEEMMEPPGKYLFWYYKMGMAKPILATLEL